jgi:putative flippase GtrA
MMRMSRQKIAAGHGAARAARRSLDEAARIVRFVVMGGVSTAIGYGLILGALACGLGDYAANIVGFALGLPVSYTLHRRHTFRAPGRGSKREAAAYLVAFVIAYGANLVVVAAGRAAGVPAGAAVQALAICVYAVVLFVLTRFMVLRPR